MAASLATRIKTFRRELNPDFLFIEPSELVVTLEIRNALAMGLRDVRYNIGPFITLVDGPAFEFLWSERKALIIGHITDADLVVISRSDLLNKEELENIKKILNDYIEGIIDLSTERDLGVAEVMDKID